MSAGLEYSLIPSLTNNKISYTRISFDSDSGISSGNATAIVGVGMEDDIPFSVNNLTVMSKATAMLVI